MAYSASSVQGPGNVRRTASEVTAARENGIKLTGAARSELFHSLRIHHRLRSSLKNGEHLYDPDEVGRAYSEHVHNCHGKGCRSGRFSAPPPGPIPEKTLSATVQVSNYFKKHNKYQGTTTELAEVLKLKETQVRQAIAGMVKKTQLESVPGGWQYIQKAKPSTAPKPEPNQAPREPAVRRDANPLEKRLAEKVEAEGGTWLPGSFTAAAKFFGVSLSHMQNRSSKADLEPRLDTVNGRRALIGWRIK